MNRILNLSNYSAEVIADSINSIWVGESGDLSRSDFGCGITTIIDLPLTEPSIIDVDCGSRQKAEKVREIVLEKGFIQIETYNDYNINSMNNSVVFIKRLPPTIG